VDSHDYEAFVSKMHSELTDVKNRVDDLESNNKNQKLAFFPSTAISFVETCVAAHLKGYEDVCDVHQSSQLGLAILENMTGNPGHQKNIHLHAFRSCELEEETATKLVQGLLYFFQEAPISLLTAGIDNITRNDRNAVAHNGGFIRAMLNIDRQQGVDIHSTETELKAFYNKIQSHVPDSNIRLEEAVRSLARAVKVNPNPDERDAERKKMTKTLKNILCKVFILPGERYSGLNGWKHLRNKNRDHRIIAV
jgi:hypothetical protein